MWSERLETEINHLSDSFKQDHHSWMMMMDGVQAKAM
jgi:hypothetical protein